MEIVRGAPGVYLDVFVFHRWRISFFDRGAIGWIAGRNRDGSGHWDIPVVGSISTVSSLPKYVGLDDDPETITHVVVD